METRMLQAGAIVGGRYRIGGRIGRGGMGEVYAAEDLRLGGKKRAVKLLAGAAAGGQELDREAAMLIALRHPHLPQIVDYFEAVDGYPAILVTDFVEGLTLRQHMEKSKRPMTAAEAMAVIRQLADALTYLHGRRPAVVHRDLKPSNVMVGADGFVSLIDFGIARHAGASADTMRLGTPGFAAPEQAGEGARSDERSDQYALGALLVYMLSGRTYDPGEQGDGRLAARYPHAPPVLMQAVQRMLDGRPEKRYASVADAWSALSAAAADNPGAAGNPLQDAAAPSMVVVASLAPGSGCTFAAVTLAKLLAASGIPAAYIERGSGVPEAFALLGGDRAAHESFGTAERDAVWRDGESGAWIIARLPAGMGHSGEDPFPVYGPVRDSICTIADIGYAWEEPGAAKLIAECGLLLVAADPFPAKWSPSRLAALGKLADDRRSEGKNTLWIANKDMPFRGREEWLNMFPERPAAAIPQLPPAAWAAWLWRGEWATSHPEWGPQLARGMRRLIGLVRELQHC